MIREVVASVALIPDAITRNVYLQSVAQRFDMSEQLVAAELGKLRTNKKERETRRVTPPPQLTEAPPEAPPIQSQPIDSRPDQFAEYDLMRILVQYGSMAIQQKQLNDKGEEEEVEFSIAEIICHELNVDELVFNNPTYARIHIEISTALSNNTLLKPSYFKRKEDQEIVKFVSEIEMNERSLSSQWISKYNIHTNTEQDKLKEAVFGSILSFKSAKVELRILEIQAELSQRSGEIEEEEMTDLLAEHVRLLGIKKTIAEKLGRIVTG